MNTSRKLRQKNEKYHSNITKRGKVELGKREEGNSLGPLVLGFLVFVVVGSALLQIIRGF
jgi:hypothetical protein